MYLVELLGGLIVYVLRHGWLISVTSSKKHEISNSLDWESISLFCLVAENGSIRAAANYSRYSAETIRRKIINLEISLGMRLFRRYKNGIVLTSNGHSILEDAYAAKANIANISRAASTKPTAIKKLSLSISPSILNFKYHPVNKLICELARTTNIRVEQELKVQSSNDVDFDIIIGSKKSNVPEMLCRKIGYTHYLLHGRETKKQKSNPQNTLSQFDGIVLLSNDDSSDAFTDTLKNQFGFNGKFHVVDSYSMVQSFVEDSNYMSVLPLIGAFEASSMRPLLPPTYPIFSRKIWLSFHSDITKYQPADNFLKKLSKCMSRKVSPWFHEDFCFPKNLVTYDFKKSNHSG